MATLLLDCYVIARPRGRKLTNWSPKNFVALLQSISFAMRVKLPRRNWNPRSLKITKIVEDLYTNISDEGLQKTSPTQFYKEIQQFQERLCYKRVKVYATISKDLMGNAGQRLFD